MVNYQSLGNNSGEGHNMQNEKDLPNIAFEFTDCKNVTMENCHSRGADKSFVFNGVGNVYQKNVTHTSREALLITHAQHLLEQNKKEIIEKDEKLYREILLSINDIKTNKFKSPLEHLEQLSSLGANTLTMWPVFSGVLMQLASSF